MKDIKPKLSTLTPSEQKAERVRFNKRFGKRFRAIRNRKKLSQEDAAYSAGYSRNNVGNIEQAKRSPSVYALWRLAEGMGVDPGEFFKDL